MKSFLGVGEWESDFLSLFVFAEKSFWEFITHSPSHILLFSANPNYQLLIIHYSLI